jgi:alpha-glucosidase
MLSPGKHQRVDIALDSADRLCYRFLADNVAVVDWSPLGLATDAPREGGGSVTVGSITRPVLHSSRFSWSLGENETIDNTYNALSIACRDSGIAFGLEVRLYDGSLAFRYTIRGQEVRIRYELTGFNLPGPFTLYQYNQESVFTPMAVDTLRVTCDLPATLTDGHRYLSIGEADNIDYTKAELAAGGRPGLLRLTYPRDSLLTVTGSFQTPWRTISVATSAIGLHDFSQLYLKLTPPGTLPPSGHGTIRPGKLIRSALTTRGGLDCVDFAAKHHFQYVLFDAGWYGAEFRSVSDPTVVIPAIDLPAVIRHGREKGIGIILYVNYAGLRAHLDTLLPLYKKWGVSGLKFGFVDGLTREGIRWLAMAIRKVNDYGFILDIHDNYKPTGLSRTWPALLTQEGIRGDENGPDAFHTTVLPFTRFLAGPADFTFCYPNEHNKFTKNLKVSKAQQMALTVIYFSPLQSIFWYGNPNDYTDERDIEFFTLVPTVWEESHYLAGEIGRYFSVARRRGDDWFIGNAAGPAGWKGSIRLDFLKAGRIYQSTIYEDDGQGGIAKRTIKLKKGDVFELRLAAAGGQALILR